MKDVVDHIELNEGAVELHTRAMHKYDWMTKVTKQNIEIMKNGIEERKTCRTTVSQRCQALDLNSGLRCPLSGLFESIEIGTFCSTHKKLRLSSHQHYKAWETERALLAIEKKREIGRYAAIEKISRIKHRVEFNLKLNWGHKERENGLRDLYAPYFKIDFYKMLDV